MVKDIAEVAVLAEGSARGNAVSNADPKADGPQLNQPISNQWAKDRNTEIKIFKMEVRNIFMKKYNKNADTEKISIIQKIWLERGSLFHSNINSERARNIQKQCRAITNNTWKIQATAKWNTSDIAILQIIKR